MVVAATVGRAVTAEGAAVPSAFAADGAERGSLWTPFVSARSGTAELRVGNEETAYCDGTVTPAGQNGSPGGSRVLGISGITAYSMGLTAGIAGAAAAALTAVTLGLAGDGIDGGEIMTGSAEAACGWAGAAGAPAVGTAPAPAAAAPYGGVALCAGGFAGCPAYGAPMTAGDGAGT